MSKGRITIPTDESFVDGTKKIIEKWGADAVRDCDGTVLPKNAKDLAEKVYNTYFIVRGDNEWARKHPEETHRAFLMSDIITAKNSTLEIEVAKGFLKDQIKADWENISYWQVFDRTTGEEVLNFESDKERGVVIIKGAKLYHQYAVDFMAKITWHPVQIYNYLTNNWTCEKQLMYDPAFPFTGEYVKKHMAEWCDAHSETNVVRFTTFLYQFTLVFNEKGKERFVDWFGYGMATSPAMLEGFKKQFGYELKAEDFVDNGCYNNTFRIPSKRFCDWMEYVQQRVTKISRELIDIVHQKGKEAMMFLGDDWIGAEPYGEHFKDLNLDAVVGSVGGGVTVRMLSEIPHVKYREGRFLPYFFPDTFFEGNEDNAVAELNKNWMTARRAMMRKPLDRIGFGGYLSLAAKFPEFVERASEICDEFRSIYSASEGSKPYAGVTVAILNAWGKIRSWMSHMVAHELWYQQIYSYQGILEALSGLPVNVKFISFDDVINNGVDSDIDVIINVGDEGTAFSGGKYWDNEKLTTAIRAFVDNGGGFIGVGEPTALDNGRGFALCDVLGVNQEKGFTLSTDKYNIEKADNHFITQDINGEIDYGEDKKNIYALENAKVLDIKFSDRFIRKVNVGEVKLAVNEYGKGRSVYITGIPYSFENSRLLYRSIYFASHKENDLNKAFSTNIATDCSYYPQKNEYAIINNSKETQVTDFYDINGNKKTLTLKGNELIWIK